MLKQIYIRFFTMTLLLFAATHFVVAQTEIEVNLDSISDDELLLWFEKYATDMTDSAEQSQLSHALISADDSLRIAHEAQEKSASNPLFMDDWVYQSDKTSQTDEVAQLRSAAQHAVWRENPDLFAYHESQLPNIDDIIRRREKGEKSQLKVDKIAPIKIDKLPKIKAKESPWHYDGDVQVQFSQNYISSNWYTGGESNMAAYFFFKGKLNYVSKKIQWDNELNAKFSFNTAAKDTLRAFRTNEDLIKYTSKLGVRAFKVDHWFYSADLELSTTLFNTYTQNTYERVTGPFSPIRLNLSIGLDYKYRSDLSVQVLPFSYKMIHVSDTTRREGVKKSIADKQGLATGTKTKSDLGSRLKVKYEHAFSREIKLETTFSLYTNYSGVEIDWEVIGNFIINRFLSARVSLNPRFDNTVLPTDGDDPRLQFKELVSVGFHYKF